MSLNQLTAAYCETIELKLHKTRSILIVVRDYCRHQEGDSRVAASMIYLFEILLKEQKSLISHI